MSEPKTRRTVALFEDAISGLEEIKKNIGAGTDNAAINEAVRFRARFANRNPEEINNALSLWDHLRREVTNDKLLFMEDREKPGKPKERTNLFIPALRA